MHIDINCDMGESFGRFKIGNDKAIMPYISSCNIACGMHGGDPKTIMETLSLAIDSGKKVGAHPSYPDRMGFGRRSMTIPHDELFSILVYQISALYTMSLKAGSALHHVKVHGALYNDAAVNTDIAHTILDAIAYIDPELYVFTLPGSAVSIAGNKRKMKILHEAFADRRYTDDLQLQSRRIEGAVIENENAAADQVINIVLHNQVTTVSGLTKHLEVDTICVHGDTPNAINIAKSIFTILNNSDITIA